MIIWIASYPKSGNTWIRSLISSYYYSEDGSFDFKLLENISQYPGPKFIKEKITKPGEVSLYWKSSQDEIIKNNKNIFLKTHNAMISLNRNFFTSEISSLGAIYIVRDPRNIITSLKNHYNFGDYKSSLEFMKSEKKYIWDERLKNDYTGFQFLGSWSKHYKSWLDNKNFKIFFLKYEELEKNAQSILYEMIKFINFLKKDKTKISKKKLVNCIDSTKFNLLKKKENEYGFPENISMNHEKKVDFFNLGPENKWEKKLSKGVLLEANNIFKEDLKFLKY